MSTIVVPAFQMQEVGGVRGFLVSKHLTGILHWISPEVRDQIDKVHIFALSKLDYIMPNGSTGVAQVMRDGVKSSRMIPLMWVNPAMVRIMAPSPIERGAYVMAHEAYHMIKGHADSNNPLTHISQIVTHIRRKWELEADEFAFTRINQRGLSLGPVISMMEEEIAIRDLIGLPKEDGGHHPPMEYRLERLRLFRSHHER